MILFDYGGTLIDELDFSPSRGNKSIYPYITENPYHVTPEDLDNYIQLMFSKIRDLRSELLEIHEHIFLRYVLEYWNIKLSISIAEAEEIMFNNMVTVQKTLSSAELLEFLQCERIQTGVISNLCWSGKVLEDRLHKHFSSHHFKFIITTSEYIFRKPDKHIFDIAVRKSGLSPKEIWYCGNDIAVDVYGAHHAGLFPVFYNNQNMPEAIHKRNNMLSVDFPHLEINNWHELINYINNY